MDLHQRQQFDVLLAQTGESFIERIVQRCAGQEAALAALQADPHGEPVWLDRFVDAVFADWCLDNAEGSAFVLTALERRRLSLPEQDPPTRDLLIRDLLITTAKRAFAELLEQKVIESMSRASVYG